jgi:hypothetical protein
LLGDITPDDYAPHGRAVFVQRHRVVKLSICTVLSCENHCSNEIL